MEVIRGCRVGAEGWRCDISSRLGPVLAPVVGSISGQTGCNWLSKDYRAYRARFDVQSYLYHISITGLNSFEY